MRSANRFRSRLGETEIAHLPLLDELGHRADRLLDRRVRVDAVLVVDVDVVGAEPLQRSVAGGEDVLAVAADAQSLALLGADVPELRREHDFVAPALDRAAHEPLVLERPVRVSRVEEVDAELERAVDRRDRLALVRRSVELGHTHAPEAQRGGLEALRAEATRLHDGNLPVAKTSPSRSRTRPAVSKSSFSTARRRASSSAARSASRRPARRSTSARDIATYSRRVT